MFRTNIHLASLIVSLSGFLFGYDAGAIGPITEMIYFFSLSPGPRGVIVASLLFSALPASIVAGVLADKYGRIAVMGSGAMASLVGMVICSTSFSLAQFIVGRIIAGIGQGLFFTLSGVWQVESAPTAVRGRIGAMSQLFITIGVAAGYFISYGTVRIASTFSWRAVTLVQSGFAALATILVLSPLVPESPRWLLVSGHPAKVARAEKIVKMYAGAPEAGDIVWVELVTDVSAESAGQRSVHISGEVIGMVPLNQEPIDGASTEATVQDGRTEVSTRPQKCTSMMKGFAIPRQYWSRAITSIILNLMVALSGIDAVLWYAPLLYAQAGLQLQSSTFIAGGIMALVMVAVSIPANAYLVDRIPRRLSIGLGALGMAISMFIIGALRSATFPGSSAKSVQWITIVLINLYVAFCYTFYMLPTFVMATEILPNKIRSTVAATARAGLSMGNIVLALSTPKWLEVNALSFWVVMGCFNLSMAIFILPETLHVPMEQIEAVWYKRQSSNRAKVAKIKSVWQDHVGDKKKPIEVFSSRPQESSVSEMNTLNQSSSASAAVAPLTISAPAVILTEVQ